MDEVVAEIREGASVAAPRGLVWRLLVQIVNAETESEGGVRSLTDEPRLVQWTTAASPRGNASPLAVEWWFRLAPSWTGTELEHGARTTGPVEELRAALLARVADVKAHAESG